MTVAADHSARRGGTAMQTTQPRDVGALLLVIGVFVILLIVVVVLPGGSLGR
jgi:hypothetical protein